MKEQDGEDGEVEGQEGQGQQHPHPDGDTGRPLDEGQPGLAGRVVASSFTFARAARLFDDVGPT